MLHPDILPFMLLHLSSPDLYATSKVCRALEDPALKELVSRPVYFRDFADIDDWYQRMHARLGESWASYLRDITIPFRDEPESESEITLQNVLDMFQRATGLRRLHLHRADDVLVPDTGIPAAISALEHLKVLYVQTEFEEVQPAMANLLANMRSCLTSLVLNGSTYVGEWTYNDLPRILRPHLSHFTELTFGSTEGLTPEIVSITLVHLSVPVQEDSPRPRQLFEAFPNLRTLILSDCTSGIYRPNDEDLERLREDRMAEQADGHVWSSLAGVEGGVLELYLLGLACPLSRLVLLDCQSQYHSAAAELVRCASPRFLRLHTYSYCRAAREEEYTDLGPIPADGSSANRRRVTHLTMDITTDFMTVQQTSDFAMRYAR